MDTQVMSQLLIGPETSLGSPAPYWLLVTLKVLGFTLHISVMHLWFAGLILAMGWRASKNEYARRLSARLLNQMPVIISVGVNLGIVPLLFLQVSYYRAFYPATILMAWPWLGIIGMLMLAYYGVYYYVVGLRTGRLTRLHLWAGWLAALLFMGIGFIFSSALTLMAQIDQWPALWERTSSAGAPLGLAHYVDPSVIARWGLMLGLAVTTLAVWVTLDAALFAGKERRDYRQWAVRLAPWLYTLGAALYAVLASYYAFGTWPAQLKETMFSPPHLLLTALTAVGPVVPFVLLWLGRGAIRPWFTVLIAVCQLGILGLQAISRQVVQNLKIAQYFPASGDSPNYQWDVLILFLLLFVGGIVLVAWMISKAAAVYRREVSEGGA
jgi:hypothetical protein